MTPTLDWAKKAFDDCNKKYFEGKLEPPTFVLDQKKNTLGCSWNHVKRLDPLGNPYYPSFIYMSTYYDRTEDELVGTMIHEMIHYWTFVNDLPVDHGDVFKAKCLEINQKTNFKYKLARTNSVKGSKVNKDIPPYSLCGRSPIVFAGVNLVGLRRRGFDSDVIRNIKDIYDMLYYQGYNFADACDRVESGFPDSVEKRTILDFIKNSKRGIVRGSDSHEKGGIE